jgi:hypothetical protein
MPIKNKKWRNITWAVLLLNGAIFFFEIIPRAGVLLDLYLQWQDQSELLDSELESGYKLQYAEKLNALLKTKIGSIVSEYDETVKVSSVIKSVDNVAEMTRTEILTLRPQPIEKKENLWLQPIEIILTGSYENFYNLIRYIELSEKVVLVKAFEMQPAELLKPELQIKLRVHVYLNM